MFDALLWIELTSKVASVILGADGKSPGADRKSPDSEVTEGTKEISSDCVGGEGIKKGEDDGIGISIDCGGLCGLALVGKDADGTRTVRSARDCVRCDRMMLAPNKQYPPSLVKCPQLLE